MEIKQSTAVRALVFYMVDSTDHVTGKTGLFPTVLLSKNGGSFAPPIGTVGEIGNGFYQVMGNAADSDTLGMLALTASATGADRCAVPYWVVANIESDSVSAITIVPTNSASAVRMNLSAELGRMDAAVSSRLPAASYIAPNNPTNAAIAAAVRTDLADELSLLDAAISTRASIASTGAQIAAFETA